MSRILPFCRGFLEHLDLIMTKETFQGVRLDCYLHTEQKRRSRKRASHWFLANFVKAVSKNSFFKEIVFSMYLSNQTNFTFSLVVYWCFSFPLIGFWSQFFSFLCILGVFTHEKSESSSDNYLELPNIFDENGWKLAVCPFSECLFLSICR